MQNKTINGTGVYMYKNVHFGGKASVFFYKSQGRYNTNYSYWDKKHLKSSMLGNYRFLRKDIKKSMLGNEFRLKHKKI